MMLQDQSLDEIEAGLQQAAEGYLRAVRALTALANTMSDRQGQESLLSLRDTMASTRSGALKLLADFRVLREVFPHPGP